MHKLVNVVRSSCPIHTLIGPPRRAHFASATSHFFASSGSAKNLAERAASRSSAPSRLRILHAPTDEQRDEAKLPDRVPNRPDVERKRVGSRAVQPGFVEINQILRVPVPGCPRMNASSAFMTRRSFSLSEKQLPYFNGCSSAFSK
jgi:hypothetical protein